MIFVFESVLECKSLCSSTPFWDSEGFDMNDGKHIHKLTTKQKCSNILQKFFAVDFGGFLLVDLLCFEKTANSERRSLALRRLVGVHELLNLVVFRCTRNFIF